jgi:uncharacterized phage protein (TIGR01671 family)
MNREIKFRAWNGEEMLFVHQLDIYPDSKVCRINCSVQSHYDKWPLMQYAGLKDKNGVEIYEGDIVYAFIGSYCYGKGKVIFHNGIFWIEWIDDKEANMEPVGCYAKPFGKVREPLEVIGNIYQNPELL